MPLIVLTAMGRDVTQAHLCPPELLREINKGKCALHAEVAAESPRGEQRILDEAGHGWLQEGSAGPVIQAGYDLVRPFPSMAAPG
ncbi:hypothetical protein [Streptomyces sp. st140]|uniref:hypothetical protein n=1 Tax=Streptomyces sp. st140 TaxID=1828052 RepID=UPI000BF042A8|nr:hypothetical protein [Streptomyces sp. st140]